MRDNLSNGILQYLFERKANTWIRVGLISQIICGIGKKTQVRGWLYDTQREYSERQGKLNSESWNSTHHCDMTEEHGTPSVDGQSFTEVDPGQGKLLLLVVDHAYTVPGNDVCLIKLPRRTIIDVYRNSQHERVNALLLSSNIRKSMFIFSLLKKE